MANILSLSDFKGGKYNIPNAGSIDSSSVTDYISKYELDYLYQLLGVTLGNLISDYIINASSGNADYDYIINPFAADNTDNCGDVYYKSLGIKEYLKAAIYYEFTFNSLKLAIPGVVDSNIETANAQGVNSTARFADNKFNEIIDTVEAIQWYISKNQSAFPDFNGQIIRVKASNII